MKRCFSLLLALALVLTLTPAAFAVATAADMAPVQEVLEAGMTPVYAKDLNEGVYETAVNSSSSMFRVERCELTVKDGALSVRLVMPSESYAFLYPGTAEDAAKAPESDDIPLTEDENGERSFTLPIEALDAAVPCAAYSRKKELWYDRTLVFRADSLPLEAFSSEGLTTAASLELPDGRYQVEVALSGGSGRAKIESPTVLTVKGGACTARITWGSRNYDYMRIGEELFYPVNTDGNSAFDLPVSVFDREMAVVADTVAMSTAHEIDYSLRFASRSLTLLAEDESARMPLRYAGQFSVAYLTDGSARLTVGDEVYRVLPRGTELPLEAGEKALYAPAERVYLASSSTADFFCALDALSRVRLTSTTAENWRLEQMLDALEKGEILYTGKYNAPDFEQILRENCDLVIENTMILHAPAIREKLEALGLPVFLDRSSYESHPLGRVEWVKVYGLLTGKAAEAEAFFDAQCAVFEALSESGDSGKTAVFFHMSPSGAVVVQKPGSYVGQMIALAGGEYIPLDIPAGSDATSGMNMQLEAFYTAAREADVLLYNSTIDDELDTIDQLLAKNALFASFKAVQSGEVWCMEKDMFQHSSAAAEVISELRAVFSGEGGEALTFLHKLA